MSFPDPKAAPSGAEERVPPTQDDRLASLKERMDSFSVELTAIISDYHRDLEAAFPKGKK